MKNAEFILFLCYTKRSCTEVQSKIYVAFDEEYTSPNDLAMAGLLPHGMESGTPHARYSIVSKSKAGWWIENIAVPYDWETAANTAQKNGRPDWAGWLRMGRA